MNRLQNTFENRWNGPLFLQVCVLILFFAFGLRFWYLQIHKGAHFAAKARENKTQSESIHAPRGIIRDRNGHLLAVNEPAYALAIVREDSRDIDRSFAQISTWTGISLEDLQREFVRGRPRVKSFEPQILVPNLSFELVSTIEAHTMDWPELKIVVQPRRHYPYNDVLSHVLGYVAQANEEELNRDPRLDLGDTVGKQGIELVLEDVLRGSKGLRQNEVDVVGRNLNWSLIREPVPGNDLALSLDMDIQKLATEQLEGQAGAIVVMDPYSGELLALVSHPGYDTNEFVKGLRTEVWQQLIQDPFHPLQNRAIQSTFPPGSVFKLAVAAAGLAEGEINPGKKVFCPGFYKKGNRVFRCWKRHGHGMLDLEGALVQSCDVYFYQLGERLGIDTISKYAKEFGFGRPTGVELPHEKGGLIPTREWKLKRFGEPWQGGETLNISIGQGYTLTTPLQVAQFISALVNGGNIYRPTLINGAEPDLQGELHLKKAHRERILKTMVETVENPRGTAWRLKKKGVEMGGKTGTSQVVKLKDEYLDKETDEIPYKFRDHGWIASYGKKGDQAYVVVVLVEHGGGGGSAASPLARAIFDKLFPEPQ
ncbi:MAG: penicillin-binding protein 2 [Desulfovibrionales bacterium]